MSRGEFAGASIGVGYQADGGANAGLSLNFNKNGYAGFSAGIGYTHTTANGSKIGGTVGGTRFDGGGWRFEWGVYGDLRGMRDLTMDIEYSFMLAADNSMTMKHQLGLSFMSNLTAAVGASQYLPIYTWGIGIASSTVYDVIDYAVLNNGDGNDLAAKITVHTATSGIAALTAWSVGTLTAKVGLAGGPAVSLLSGTAGFLGGMILENNEFTRKCIVETADVFRYYSSGQAGVDFNNTIKNLQTPAGYNYFQSLRQR